MGTLGPMKVEHRDEEEEDEDGEDTEEEAEPDTDVSVEADDTRMRMRVVAEAATLRAVPVPDKGLTLSIAAVQERVSKAEHKAKTDSVYITQSEAASVHATQASSVHCTQSETPLSTRFTHFQGLSLQDSPPSDSRGRDKTPTSPGEAVPTPPYAASSHDRFGRVASAGTIISPRDLPVGPGGRRYQRQDSLEGITLISPRPPPAPGDYQAFAVDWTGAASPIAPRPWSHA
jgi:hypothetical protein